MNLCIFTKLWNRCVRIVLLLFFILFNFFFVLFRFCSVEWMIQDIWNEIYKMKKKNVFLLLLLFYEELRIRTVYSLPFHGHGYVVRLTLNHLKKKNLFWLVLFNHSILILLSKSDNQLTAMCYSVLKYFWKTIFAVNAAFPSFYNSEVKIVSSTISQYMLKHTQDTQFVRIWKHNVKTKIAWND